MYGSHTASVLHSFLVFCEPMQEAHICMQDTIIQTTTPLSYHEQKLHLAGAEYMGNEKVI